MARWPRRWWSPRSGSFAGLWSARRVALGRSRWSPGCSCTTASWRGWSAKLALVGPAFARDAVERHYAESLAALELIPPASRRLLDLGSGAGFPGLVLAIARPDLEVVLVEARERKWAFLEASRRRLGLSCRIVGATVDRTLPAEIPVPYDVVTSRAISLSPQAVLAVTGGFRPDGAWLAWVGPGESFRPKDWRAGPVRALSLGSQRRIETWFRPPGALA